MKKIIVMLMAAIVFTAGIIYAATVNLPETGQTTCYDATGAVIACTSTGQDGDLEMGVAWPSPRFTAGTGTEADCVTDELTGLMWVKSPDSTTRTWANALIYANALSLCGYTDWRLPNVNEIESLVNAEQASIAIWLNTQGFSNVQADYYWSSSTIRNIAADAWSVHMLEGSVENVVKTNSSYVWPVRSGQ